MLRVRLALAALAIAGLFGGWMWLRDSSFFSVDSVRITGLSGPAAPAARAALASAARHMTTMHVRTGELRAAVAGVATIQQLSVSTSFPHCLQIHVVQRRPVGVVLDGARRISVAADGTILSGPARSELPVLASGSPPAGSRLTDPQGTRALSVLDAAPAVLRGRIGRVGSGPDGLTVYIHQGPALYFGDTTRLRAKWAAALAVMADATARGASYIDLRQPDRPAAQLADPATTPGAAAGGPAASRTTATP